jgi:CRP-like cAMP-binding protein
VVVTAVLEGSVKLTRAGERGDPQLLRLLGPGDVFGLRPLLAGDTFAVAALALEPVRAATYPAAFVHELLQESPAFAMTVLTRLARELRYSEDMLMVLTQRPVKRRIAEVLLLLHGRRIDGEDWAPFPPVRLKRKEIAQMVGTTPETLSRTLAEFAAAGLIRVDRRRVAIRDEAGLQRVERVGSRGRA